MRGHWVNPSHHPVTSRPREPQRFLFHRSGGKPIAISPTEQAHQQVSKRLDGDGFHFFPLAICSKELAISLNEKVMPANPKQRASPVRATTIIMASPQHLCWLVVPAWPRYRSGPNRLVSRRGNRIPGRGGRSHQDKSWPETYWPETFSCSLQIVGS